ncbi:MAG: antibiotic biosynthesis monooxygenase [Paracoccus denitrificans]|nr:MAG: antibiotic biosynthesis monooxygenase [Paracoccus denitrificans]PZO83504.1 MAG: antibiotic biosynthesis monooxygenase [Paracoccus denitrificans]
MSDCGCSHHHNGTGDCRTALVTVQGRLICADLDQLVTMMAHIDRHAELTRAEPGCVWFTVAQTDDPLIWDVSEGFRDAQSLRDHQSRLADSDWGRATTEIQRDYKVTGIND